MTACLTHPLGKVFLSLSAKVRIKPSPTAKPPPKIPSHLHSKEIVTGNPSCYFTPQPPSSQGRNIRRFASSFQRDHAMLTESLKSVPKYRGGFPARTSTNPRRPSVGQAANGPARRRSVEVGGEKGYWTCGTERAIFWKWGRMRILASVERRQVEAGSEWKVRRYGIIRKSNILWVWIKETSVGWAQKHFSSVDSNQIQEQDKTKSVFVLLLSLSSA